MFKLKLLCFLIITFELFFTFNEKDQNIVWYTRCFVWLRKIAKYEIKLTTKGNNYVWLCFAGSQFTKTSFVSFADIRVQLNDQLKCLDGRLEIQQGIVTEFQDIFRRRAEIELNYSKELDKLSKAITNRNKEHKQK